MTHNTLMEMLEETALPIAYDIACFLIFYD